MKDRVRDELLRLKADGVIEEFNNSEWATPIVPILKKDETTCICGNYNVKLNKVCKLYSYLIPRLVCKFSMLGGIMFTSLD